MKIGTLVRHIEYECIGILVRHGGWAGIRWTIQWNDNSIPSQWYSEWELEVLCR